jgi:hypothetical protein
MSHNANPIFANSTQTSNPNIFASNAPKPNVFGNQNTSATNTIFNNSFSNPNQNIINPQNNMNVFNQ